MAVLIHLRMLADLLCNVDTTLRNWEVHMQDNLIHLLLSFLITPFEIKTGRGAEATNRRGMRPRPCDDLFSCHRAMPVCIDGLGAMAAQVMGRKHCFHI